MINYSRLGFAKSSGNISKYFIFNTMKIHALVITGAKQFCYKIKKEVACRFLSIFGHVHYIILDYPA